MLRIDGELFTPPVEAGLLPGTYRAALLARGRLKERRLTRTDLASADRIFIINSVRGWVPLELQTKQNNQPTNKSGVSHAFVSEP